MGARSFSKKFRQFCNFYVHYSRELNDTMAHLLADPTNSKVRPNDMILCLQRISHKFYGFHNKVS